MAAQHTLPDDAQVVAITALGDRRSMTLAEACNAWKDSRYFGIDHALRTRGEYRALMLTIRLQSFKVGGWTISYDPPPIPTRSMDWAFAHDNFDASYEGEEDGWVSNGLAGRAASPQDCLDEISEMAAEAVS